MYKNERASYPIGMKLLYCTKMTDTVNGKQKSNTPLFLCVLWTGISTSFLYYAFSTAMTSVTEEMSVSVTQGHWLVSIYSVGMGITILLNAYLSKRIPTKRYYLGAILLILVGVSIALFAKKFSVLLIGRTLQALGHGVTLALGQQVLFEVSEPNKRGMIIGWYGFSISCSQAFAPLLSGIMTDTVNWRMILWIGIGMLFLSFVLNLFRFQNVLETNRRPSISFDCLSLKTFRKATLLNGLLFAIMMGGTVGFPVYLQNELGKTATVSGMILLPGSFMIALISPLSGKLYDRLGFLPLGKIGSLLLFLGTAGMSCLVFFHADNLILLAGVFLIRGCAIGLFMMPLTTWGLSELEKKDATVGNSILTGLRTIGGTLGSAVTGLVNAKTAFMLFTCFSLGMVWVLFGMKQNRK